MGRLFGLRKADMPRTLADLDDYRSAMLDGDRLHVTPWARERARSIVLEPPVPRYLQPLVETVNFVTIALLPDRIRDEYGFAPLPPAFVRKALVRAGAEYVRRGGGAVPAGAAAAGARRTRGLVHGSGWGAGTRTPITSSRGWRLAIRRPPKGLTRIVPSLRTRPAGCAHGPAQAAAWSAQSRYSRA